MRKSKALVLLAILVPALACAEDPWGRLKHLFGEPFGVNAECIQRRVPSDGGDPMVVKIEVSKSIGLISSVLEPTSFQGIVMTDDNVTMRSYYPDQSLIFVQPSPGRYRLPLDERMALAKKNYDIKEQARVSVAGRPGFRYLLVPRDRAMQQRRLTLDSKENFLLRGERFEDKKWLVTVDTVSVSFLSDQPFKTPTIETSEEVKTKDSWGPKPMDNYIGSIQRSLGFMPTIPAILPHGFALSEKQVALISNTTAAVFRLTDGVANATVYIYRLHRGQKPSGEEPDTFAMGPNGVKYAVAGDIPSDVSVSLAEAFARVENTPKAEGS